MNQRESGKLITSNIMFNDIIKKPYDKWAVIPNTLNSYCNSFVSEVLTLFYYYDFNGRTANRIIEIMEFEKAKWKQITAETWDKQSLVIACEKGTPHGHVNVLLQGDFESSGKWNKAVPICANIGKTNYWAKGENWSFQTEPSYYQYTNYIPTHIKTT